MCVDNDVWAVRPIIAEGSSLGNFAATGGRNFYPNPETEVLVTQTAVEAEKAIASILDFTGGAHLQFAPRFLDELLVYLSVVLRIVAR